MVPVTGVRRELVGGHQNLPLAPQLHVPSKQVGGYHKAANLRDEFQPSVFLRNFH